MTEKIIQVYLDIENEKSCGKCKHIRIDGLYDIWCSIRGKDKYYYAKNCPNYRSVEK